jgi:hypothetical protein
MNHRAYRIFPPLSATVTCLSLLISASPVFSQAVVESAILGAASGTAATGVKGAGAATAGVFEALRKTLNSVNGASPQAGPATVEASTAATNTVVAAAAISKENRAFEPKDLSGVVVGKTRQELVDKYGQPALKTTETNDEHFIERYTYMQTKNDTVVVELRAGVVSKVELKPSKASRSVISLK